MNETKKLKQIMTPEGLMYLSPDIYGYEGEPQRKYLNPKISQDAQDT